VEYVISPKLKEVASLMSSFLSAIISAMLEAIGMGGVRMISLEQMDVVLGLGKNTIVAMFVSNPVALHYVIARRIIGDIDKLQIPSIISEEIQEKVLDRVREYLLPLFP